MVLLMADEDEERSRVFGSGQDAREDATGPPEPKDGVQTRPQAGRALEV